MDMIVWYEYSMSDRLWKRARNLSADTGKTASCGKRASCHAM